MEPGDPRSIEELLAEQRRHDRGWWLTCGAIALLIITPLIICMVWYVQTVMSCKSPMCF